MSGKLGQCSGELVGAAGAPALAIDPRKAFDNLVLVHTNAKGRQPLSVAVAAFGVLKAEAHFCPFITLSPEE